MAGSERFSTDLKCSQCRKEEVVVWANAGLEEEVCIGVMVECENCGFSKESM